MFIFKIGIEYLGLIPLTAASWCAGNVQGHLEVFAIKEPCDKEGHVYRSLLRLEIFLSKKSSSKRNAAFLYKRKKKKKRLVTKLHVLGDEGSEIEQRTFLPCCNCTEQCSTILKLVLVKSHSS